MNPIRKFYSTESDNPRRTINHFDKRCSEIGWEPEALAVVWDIPMRWYSQYIPQNAERGDFVTVTGKVRDRTYEEEVYSMCYVVEFRYYNDAVVYKLSKHFDNDVTIIDGRKNSD